MSKVIFAHFDSYGAATSVALARRKETMIIMNFPESGYTEETREVDTIKKLAS